MEAGNVEFYEKIAPKVYALFLITSIIANVCLIACAVSSTPKHLRTLRYLLMTTSFLHILVSLILFFIQPRVVAGVSRDIPVYCYGWCKEIDNNTICFGLYMFWQASSLGVAITLTFTIFFKYYKFTRDKTLSICRIAVFLLFAYIPFYISMSCAVIITLSNALPKEAGKHPGDKEPKYTEIGKMTLGQKPNIINFVMLALGIFLLPVLALYFNYKSHKRMNILTTAASPVLRSHSKTAMKGLNIQMIYHFLFYVPMFSLYIYCIVTSTEFYFLQFFLTLSPNLTATLDPLINLFFVVPFWDRILRLLGKKPVQVGNVEVISI